MYFTYYTFMQSVWLKILSWLHGTKITCLAKVTKFPSHDLWHFKIHIANLILYYLPSFLTYLSLSLMYNYAQMSSQKNLMLFFWYQDGQRRWSSKEVRNFSCARKCSKLLMFLHGALAAGWWSLQSRPSPQVKYKFYGFKN